MRTVALLGALLAAGPAYAQDHVHQHAAPAASGPAKPAPAADAHDHAQHQPAPAASAPAANAKGRVLYYKNPMGEPDTSPVPKKDSMGMDYIPVYDTEAPPIITDHAADRYYDPGLMAAARDLLRLEHGGMPASFVALNILELQSNSGGEGYRWEGEAWYGGDRHRAVFKFKGEGEIDGSLEEAEAQVLYAKPIGPYFNLQAGLRYDIKPDPSRVYAALGVEGLAPYWFDVAGALFVSDQGDVHARLEGYYDLNLTQRLILQPRAEVDIAAQNVPDLHTGAGISSVEAELRLRYEIRRAFAPYIGVSFERKTGRTAQMARVQGEPVSATRLVGGVKMFF